MRLVRLIGAVGLAALLGSCDAADSPDPARSRPPTGADADLPTTCGTAAPEPNTACAAPESVRCAWGTDCCCGRCFDEFICRCDNARWLCHYGDFCLGASACENPDSGVSDTGGAFPDSG